MKAGNNWLKYLKWLYMQPPFPRAWGSHSVPGCPALGVSSSHRLLTSSECARNQTMCQPHSAQWSPIPWKLLPCWRTVFKTVILAASPARRTGDSTPVTSSVLVPQQSAWPSPCVSHSLEMNFKHGMCPRQKFSLYLFLCCNKSRLDRVPPLW